MEENKGSADLDYRDTESVKSYVSQLEAENQGLKNQVHALKKVLKTLQPGRTSRRLPDLRRELESLLTGGEAAFYS